MKNHSIKRNPKPLSDEQINRHKDFKKLLTTQQGFHMPKKPLNPLYKNKGFMGFLILLGVIILLLLLDTPEKPVNNFTLDSLATTKADSSQKIPSTKK